MRSESRTIWIGEESAKGYQEAMVRYLLPLLKELIEGAEAAVAETAEAEGTQVNEGRIKNLVLARFRTRALSETLEMQGV